METFSFVRERRERLSSDGHLLTLISGDEMSGGEGGSLDGRRPTRLLRNCSNLRLRGMGAVPPPPTPDDATISVCEPGWPEGTMHTVLVRGIRDDESVWWAEIWVLWWCCWW